MKIPPVPHGWSVTPSRAVAIQRRLASAVEETAETPVPRLVAGCDAAFSRDGRFCVAGVVVWDCRERRVVEERVARRRLGFPYIPGLLSFREAPALLDALRRLETTPDLLLCDGHGRAHPRRLGIACHLGILADRPSVGCAKSRLVGTHAEPAARRGSRRALRAGDETLGVVLRTRDGVRPVYVSVGHRIDLAGAVRVVLRCGAGYRLPEPTRLADRLVARER